MAAGSGLLRRSSPGTIKEGSVTAIAFGDCLETANWVRLTRTCATWRVSLVGEQEVAKQEQGDGGMTGDIGCACVNRGTVPPGIVGLGEIGDLGSTDRIGDGLWVLGGETPANGQATRCLSARKPLSRSSCCSASMYSWMAWWNSPSELKHPALQVNSVSIPLQPVATTMDKALTARSVP